MRKTVAIVALLCSAVLVWSLDNAIEYTGKDWSEFSEDTRVGVVIGLVMGEGVWFNSDEIVRPSISEIVKSITGFYMEPDALEIPILKVYLLSASGWCY